MWTDSGLHTRLFAFEIGKRTTPSLSSNTVAMKLDLILETTYKSSRNMSIFLVIDSSNVVQQVLVPRLPSEGISEPKKGGTAHTRLALWMMCT